MTKMDYKVSVIRDTLVLLYLAMLAASVAVARCSPPTRSQGLSILPRTSINLVPSRYCSKLWECDGQRWDHERLPDYSYAGYLNGTALPPRPPVTLTLTTSCSSQPTPNCTATLLTLLNTTACRNAKPCVIYLPLGTYHMTDVINITGSVILRGTGVNKTTLYFSQPREAVEGLTEDRLSFGPGYINFNGEKELDKTSFLAAITRDASRGDKVGYVNSTQGIKAGDWVRVTASDPGTPGGNGTGALISYLYNSTHPKVETTNLTGALNVVRIISRVTAVRQRENAIVLERPIHYDLRPKLWLGVEVHRFQPVGFKNQTAQPRGIEDLSISFPKATQYQGHFKEQGYNGVFFYNVANCFARNINIHNADFSLGANGCNFCTLTGVSVTADREPDEQGYFGHHGISISSGSNNLITDFNIAAPQVHDLTLESYTTHTVICNGTGKDLNLDFHRSGPYSNLVTDVTVGKGTRPYHSGGRDDRGPHAASWQTLWNVRASKGGQTLPLPEKDFGTNLNVVGTKHVGKAAKGWWVEEVLAGRVLYPADLYTAQVRKRLGKTVYA